MDIATHTREDKRRFRDFSIINDYNKEVLNIEMEFSLANNLVVKVLNHHVNRRGKPNKIGLDNSPKLITNISP